MISIKPAFVRLFVPLCVFHTTTFSSSAGGGRTVQLTLLYGLKRVNSSSRRLQAAAPAPAPPACCLSAWAAESHFQCRPGLQVLLLLLGKTREQSCWPAWLLTAERERKLLCECRVSVCVCSAESGRLQITDPPPPPPGSPVKALLCTTGP
jgi:hypothetical protein